MTAAKLYAALCGLLIVFQLSLVFGAPLGHLTQGGFHPGVLPISGRIMAGASAALLLAMALIVLRHARGQISARWPIWGVLGITALTTLANLATPSAAERALWGPVAVVMLICVLRVWWRGLGKP